MLFCISGECPKACRKLVCGWLKLTAQMDPQNYSRKLQWLFRWKVVRLNISGRNFPTPVTSVFLRLLRRNTEVYNREVHHTVHQKGMFHTCSSVLRAILAWRTQLQNYREWPQTHAYRHKRFKDPLLRTHLHPKSPGSTSGFACSTFPGLIPGTTG